MPGSSAPRLLLVHPLPDARIEVDLRARADVFAPASLDHADVAAGVQAADGVILRAPTEITAGMIAQAPWLRVIGELGSGVDHIDLSAATERGIPVVNGAGVASRAVAEYVIAAMVVAHRRVMHLHQRMATGQADWALRLHDYRGIELTGTTLGIVGYGHIGREVARMAVAAFGMEILAYSPSLPKDTDTTPATRLDDLDELLARSLTVTVHTPLTPRSRGLLGAEQIARLGPEAVLINVARGGVVDEEAVVLALASGALKGVVLDVFADEPPSPERLRRLGALPNVVLTPHVAGITDQGMSNLSRNVVDGVLAALDGHRPPRLANPEVRFPNRSPGVSRPDPPEPRSGRRPW